MLIAAICTPIISYLGVRFWMKRHPTLSSFGVVYFSYWSIIGGLRVLDKCIRGGGNPIQFSETDLMCVGFGIISMVWISFVSIWSQLSPKQSSQRSDE